MINLQEMRERLKWLNQNLVIMQNEKTAIELLLELYDSPEYHQLRQLQEDDAKQEVVKAKPKPPKELYTEKKMFGVVDQRQQLKLLLLRATMKPESISTDPKETKKLGMSNVTVRKWLNSMMHFGYLELKRDGTSKKYKVPQKHVEQIRKRFPVVGD